MQIQIPNHNIKESNQININDIPLAYINTDDSKLTTDIIVEKKFLTESISPVRPYEQIIDSDTLFFKKDKTIIKDLELKRYGNNYIYEPQGMVEFTPESFSCSVLIKKNMSYKSNQSYNLKVAVIEDSTELTYASNMLKIFADAYRRGIIPPNISINNKSLRPESLISSSLIDNDFVFAHSINGVDITDEEGKVIDVKINELLDNHVNVWLSVDEFDILVERNTKDVSWGKPLLFNKTNYTQSIDKIKVFDTEKTHASYPETEYNYEYLSNSILILEKRNKGFLVITPAFILNDLNSNSSLIYEVIMNVFLRAYYKSLEAVSWITDELVDYMAYCNKKLQIRHKSINLNTLLNNANYEIGDEYSFLSVDISNANVMLSGMANKGELSFKKIKATDPAKKDGDISFLTTKQTIVNYQESDIYRLETKLNINSIITDNVAYITILPYISSSYKIHTNESHVLALKDFNIQHYLCTKPTSPQITNTFELIPMDKYSYDKHGYILAYITLTSKKDTKTYDVRIMGGGLPLSTKDTTNNKYNMIDIGNVYGRPYRLANTAIIRLPKQCEKYNNIILKEINKHIDSYD